MHRALVTRFRSNDARRVEATLKVKNVLPKTPVSGKHTRLEIKYRTIWS